jgi:hypothetical protein
VLVPAVVVDRVEDEFDARGDAQLLEYVVEVLLDGVLADSRFAFPRPGGGQAGTDSGSADGESDKLF